MAEFPREPPPPYGFREPPPNATKTTTTVYTVPVPVAVPVTVATMEYRPLGPESQIMICPSCHHQIQTRTESEATTRTHLMALLLCLFFWPCVWLPYVMDNCKSVNHYCPHCNAYLGAYNM